MNRLVFAILVLAPAAAVAEPAVEDDGLCEEHVTDPVALAWRESGIDAPRSACLHADLGVTLGGRMVLDTDNFYGSLVGTTVASARFLESDQLEWGFALRLLDLTFVQNAVLKVDEVGYGPISAHVAYGSRGRIFKVPRRSAYYARVELPFTRSRLDGSTGALQLGVADTWRLTARIRFYSHAAALAWYASSTSGRDFRTAIMGAADVGYAPVHWLGLTAGLDVQLGYFGYDAPVMAVHGSAHWRVKGLWRVELAAGTPLLGDERADLHVNLGLRRDLD